MGKDAFVNGLREILESTSIKKVIYDCRADSDALYHLFGVTLRGIRDCQVAVMSRPDTIKLGSLKGFKKVLEECREIFPTQRAFEDFRRTKTIGAELFELHPTIWDRRPLDKRLLNYACGDIDHLLPFFDHEVDRMIPTMNMKRLEKISNKRAIDTINHPNPTRSHVSDILLPERKKGGFYIDLESILNRSNST